MSTLKAELIAKHQGLLRKKEDYAKQIDGFAQGIKMLEREIAVYETVLDFLNREEGSEV